ncbi:unannotated protein [freshwater metagenome]|uniref:Unannotated protein n=1 Tax=freshwater metagenome TaxID=449393 RepID=A0A6J7JG63_9ZZZZ
MTQFVIGVTTLHRPELLRRLLASLAETTALDQFVHSIIVVDNDPDGGTRDVVTAACLPVAVRYVVEPVRGYASPRNAVIESREHDLPVCFLDDDEVVATDWAAQMAVAHQRFPLAIIQGSVRVEHEGWPRFKEGRERDPGIRIGATAASTANTLFPSAVWDDAGLRFDTQFNLSGGEDTDLLLRWEDLGGEIRWWPAQCTEPAHPDRDGLLAYLARAENSSMTYARIMRQRRRRRTALAISGLLRCAVGTASGAVTVGSRHEAAHVKVAIGRGLLRGLFLPSNRVGGQ